MNRVYEQLWDLRHVYDDWDGYGAIAPNFQAITAAKSIIDSCQGKIVPTSTRPALDGGVLVVFDHGSKSAYFECKNSGLVYLIENEWPNQSTCAPISFTPIGIASALDQIIEYLQ